MNVTTAQLAAMQTVLEGGNPWRTRRAMAATLRDAGLLGDDNRHLTAAGLRLVIEHGSEGAAVLAMEALEAQEAKERAAPAVEPAVSPAALQYARRVARGLLSNRTGHGGGPCSYRQLDETQLIALAAMAFDAGVKAMEGQ